MVVDKFLFYFLCLVIPLFILSYSILHWMTLITQMSHQFCTLYALISKQIYTKVVIIIVKRFNEEQQFFFSASQNMKRMNQNERKKRDIFKRWKTFGIFHIHEMPCTANVLINYCHKWLLRHENSMVCGSTNKLWPVHLNGNHKQTKIDTRPYEFC